MRGRWGWVGEGQMGWGGARERERERDGGREKVEREMKEMYEREK